MSLPPPDPTEEAVLPVTFGEVSVFLRLLIHDVRNSFNALDLQLAAAVEVAENPSAELVRDVSAARRMISEETKRLFKLAEQIRSFKVEKISYPVSELVEDLRDRAGRVLGPEAAPEWTGDEKLSGSVAVDVERYFSAVTELLRNAFFFREGKGPVRVLAQAEGGHLAIEITQPRSAVDGDPAAWGRQPFQSSRRGGYGLGLFAARRTLGLLGGTLELSFEASRGLVRTRVTLPLEAAG